MSGTRRSFESGHRPKFMVVVDDTPECRLALRFAARRCRRTGASLLMLAIVEPPDNFEWLGVGDALKAEAEEMAASRLDAAAAAVLAADGPEPERAVRVGDRAATIGQMIDEDEDISFLVLACGTGSAGPGPLVTSLAGRMSAAFPVPIVLVPGDLADAAIDALAG